MKTKPLVVAIAAVSGGGKTTIVKMLESRLPKARALYFDDREYDVESGIDDVCEWIEAGADHELWKLGPLENDIKELLAESKRPLDFILLDYPFAYRHRAMAELIDYAIFVDTPLDIAMARRILRDFSQKSGDEIRTDVEIYLARGRSAYLSMLRTIGLDSDFVVDGSTPLEAIVDAIAARLETLRAGRQ